MFVTVYKTKAKLWRWSARIWRGRDFAESFRSPAQGFSTAEIALADFKQVQVALFSELDVQIDVCGS